MTLPLGAIHALALPFSSKSFTMLADGTIHSVDLYELEIKWDGKSVSIEVECADAQPLLGMALLDGFKLTIEARVSGAVWIEPLL